MKIGSLEIELLAEMARLKKDLDEVKNVVGGAMSSISASVANAQRALFGLGGALVGVGSAAAFKGMVAGIVETKVELARLATQTGATVESLSAISTMAKLNGTDIGSVGSAMNKLQKNLASSTEESKGAAQAIKALGINFEEFSRMSADQQMLKVAKSMAEFTDGGGKSAAAMLLFGKAGAQLLPMLKDLAEQNELVGKQTTASALQAEEYEKNLKKLNMAGMALKREFVEGLLPSMEHVTAEMVRARKEGEGLFGMLAAGAKAWWSGTPEQQANKNFAEIVEKKLEWEKEIQDLRQRGFNDDSRGMRSAQMKLDMINKQLGAARGLREAMDPDNRDGRELRGQTRLKQLDPNLGAKVPVDPKIKEGEAFLVQLQRQVEQITKGKFAMLELEAAQKGVGKAAQQYIDILREREELEDRIRIMKEDEARRDKRLDVTQGLRDQLYQQLQAIEEQTEALGLNAEAQARLTAKRAIDKALLSSMKGAYEDQHAELIKLAADMNGKLGPAMDELKRRQDALNASWQYGAQTALDEYLKQVNDVAGQTNRLFTNAFKGAEDALVKFVTTGKLDFKSLMNSIVAELARAQIQQSITGPLAGMMKGGIAGTGGGGSLFGSFTSLLGSLFGGGSAYTPPSAIGIGPRAEGGPVSAGMPYLVGERGPEVVVPRASATVVPNSALGGKSVTISTTINIDSRTDRAAVYADVSRAMEANNQRFADQLRQQGVLG